MNIFRFRKEREAQPEAIGHNEKGTATQRSSVQTAVLGGGPKPPSPALSRKTFALLLVAHCENLRVIR